MNGSHLVTQANNLIEARHNNPLTAREQKIILTMVSGIEPQDEDFKDYSISLKNFSEMLGLEGSTKYTEIKEIMKSLMEKTVEIPSKNGGWLLTHWVSSAEYVNGEGIIKLSFSPKLKPYMLQLKDQFTSYRLSNVLSLNSTYSIRLYELMKKWQHLGRWENPVEELKLKFGVPKDSYSRYNHFKTRVILRAVEEVNEKTDLFIDFKEIKKGRSVERIEFIIKHSAEKEIKLTLPPKKPEKTFENEDVRERLNDLARDFNLDQTFFAQMYQGALLIWNDATENELSLLIRYVNQEETVKNPLGFIKSKIKTAWEIHQNGFPITFADLKSNKRRTGRTEVVPEWFHERDESNEKPQLSEEAKKQKRELLASFGKSSEEIEELMKGE